MRGLSEAIDSPLDDLLSSIVAFVLEEDLVEKLLDCSSVVISQLLQSVADVKLLYGWKHFL